MTNGEHYKDEVVIENICKEIKEKGSTLIVDKKFTVDGNLNFILQMDVVVRMRPHPLIAASLIRIPLVGIIAHPKVANFLSQVKQKEYRIPYEKLDPAEFNKKLKMLRKK